MLLLLSADWSWIVVFRMFFEINKEPIRLLFGCKKDKTIKELQNKKIYLGISCLYSNK